jgi:hypothetical protein
MIICESSILYSEGVVFSHKHVINKGMKFNSLDELKFFLADYVVKHFRPFSVVHSDKNLMCEVICKQRCLWHVWARLQRYMGKWKFSKVVQPHTCCSTEVKGVHAQLSTHYLRRRLLGTVRTDYEVSTFMETIFEMSGYHVGMAG